MRQPKSGTSTFQKAMAAHRAGQRREAQKLFEKVLSRDPKHRGALDALSVIETQSGRYDQARVLLNRLIELSPKDPRPYLILGEVNQRLGQPAEALKTLRYALQLKPDFVEALYSIGIFLLQSGQIDSAIQSFEGALDIKPEASEVQLGLAKALSHRGDDERARLHQRCAELLRGSRKSTVTWQGLWQEALAYLDSGQRAHAIACYQAALALNPEFSLLRVQLSLVLRDIGRIPGAIHAARAALRTDPDSPIVMTALAAALVDAKQLDDAEALANQAIAIDSALADAHFHLARALFGRAEVHASIASFRRAIEINPNHLFAHSGLIFAMPYVSGYSQRAIDSEARAWAKRHVASLAAHMVPHQNDPSPDRRLRVGYLSGDFCLHPVANFFVPILEHHDRNELELFCYSSVGEPDELTQRIRQGANVFRDVAGWSDFALVDLIRQDKIDVLVDLSLRSGNQRLRTLACKPAPIQIIGYLGTTGLDTVDYRITAPFLDMPSVDESDGYSELPLPLPQTYWCYGPLEFESLVEPAHNPPAAKNGYITFGSQNSFHKVSPETLELWASVLCAVPNSKLIMHAPLEGQARVISLLANHGVTRDRVTFVPRRDRSEYMSTYSTIDLCLDTIPYSGATTTLDGFWMGTPTLTLAGQMPVGRAGLHICMNLGAAELIAESPTEFVTRAVELTSDLARLAELRASLRPRLRVSAIMDAPGFTRDLEAAYRKAWQTWCAATSA